MIEWKPLCDEAQLENIIDNSQQKLQVIFKHSTRCSISSMVKTRLERSLAPENVDFNYLDLIKYRRLSNRIADIFQIRHESPQVIVLKNGDPVFNESHSAILMEDISNIQNQ